MLRQRKAREAERIFVVEGTLNVMAALQADAGVEAVFAAPDADDTVVSEARGRGVTVHELDRGVIERVADTVTPQGVLATVAYIDRPLSELAEAGFLVVCANVRDPGNAGTMLRTAEAAGVDGVICADGSVDVYNPKTVRASAGSIFRVPIVAGGDAVGVVNQLQHWGMTSIGAAAHGGVDPAATDMRGRIALVFGNEADGIPSDVDAVLDARVTVPLQGRAESLNVGMAAAVIAFEAARQRRGSE